MAPAGAPIVHRPEGRSRRTTVPSRIGLRVPTETSAEDAVTERMQDSAATRRRVRDLANLEHPAHGLGTHVVARIELVGASRTPGSFKRPRNGRCRTIGLLVAGPSSHRAAVTGVGVKRPAILRNDPAAPRRHVSLGIDHRTLWASGRHARIWWWLSDKPTSSSTLCIRHKVTILRQNHFDAEDPLWPPEPFSRDRPYRHCAIHTTGLVCPTATARCRGRRRVATSPHRCQRATSRRGRARAGSRFRP